MIKALTDIGHALSTVWKTQEEDAQGRVFFSMTSQFETYDTHKSTLNVRPGSNMSAHHRMEIEALPSLFEAALEQMAQTLADIPALALNKIRPALNLQLVGDQTTTPLQTPGAVQGMGGLTPYANKPFLDQSVWLTPMGRNSHTFESWCENEVDRWAKAASLRASENSPYWFIHTDKPTKNNTCPALQATTEEDALTLYELLFPFRNPDVKLTCFSRDTPPPPHLQAWK